MLLNALDKKIRQAFSNAATQYEALTSLQVEIGRELISRIDAPEKCDHILDVGMGTGRLTNRLHMLFPDSKVVGMDFAYGMVEAAQKKYEGFPVLQADANALPFQSEIFDVVFSNAAYHWVGHFLPEAFAQIHRVLKNDGSLYMTLFGQGTLNELFASFAATVPTPTGLSIQRLPSDVQVKGALQVAGLKNIEIQTEIIKTHFEDMLALIRWLKDIGANMLQKDFFVGKERLARANEYYKENFRDAWGVYATFEVIWVKAKKEN